MEALCRLENPFKSIGCKVFGALHLATFFFLSSWDFEADDDFQVVYMFWISGHRLEEIVGTIFSCVTFYSVKVGQLQYKTLPLPS